MSRATTRSATPAEADAAYAPAPSAPSEVPATAGRELWGRYRAIFSAAWAVRHELAGPRLHLEEAAFLPAALSLQHTPVHPSPRRAAYAVMALFIIAIVWASLGKIDVVSTAPGRIIVSERTKVIQPLEPSVVRAVLVKDGDKVKAGQLLIELDPTMANADKASVQEQLDASSSELQRTDALLKALGSTSNANITNVLDGFSGAASRAQLMAEWQDIRAKLAKLSAEASHRQAEIATVKETIAKFEATVPMAQSREQDFKRLVGEGFISGHATQDKTRERIEMERDLVVQRAKLVESQSALAESENTRASFQAETRRALQDRNAVAATKVQQLSQDKTKATQRERLTRLTAPVDGTVQQLTVHSVGGVVTAAQTLMIVVPDSPTATAEVNIANLDIGFVYAGQKASVKLETFPYTKYGTVSATVDVVTADAVTEEKRGSYYPATLTLDKRTMNIDGKQVPISPGMNVTAEIKTGERRVIEYLLSPIQRAGGESLRER